MSKHIVLAEARAALIDHALVGFVDVVAAEGIVERCTVRTETTKAGITKPPVPAAPGKQI